MDVRCNAQQLDQSLQREEDKVVGRRLWDLLKDDENADADQQQNFTDVKLEVQTAATSGSLPDSNAKNYPCFLLDSEENKGNLRQLPIPGQDLSLLDRRRLSWNVSSSRILPVPFSPEYLSLSPFNRNRLTNPVFLGGSLTGAGYALEGLRFISRTTGNLDRKQLWDAVEKRFHELASGDGTLSRSQFAACIGMGDSADFAEELFDALSRRRGEDSLQTISLEDLHDYWSQITDGSFDSRMQLFFDLCDKDSDGRIAEEEVKEVIMLSASSNKLSILQEQAEEYAALIMEELDGDKQGYIEVSQLESLFRVAAEGLSSDAYLNYSQTFGPPRRRNWLCWATRKVKFFCMNHWQRIWILAAWLVAMGVLFAWKFVQYKLRMDFEVMGYCVCTAKGAAETLKLNMALILLPVCRNTITWMRSSFLGSIVPFNDNINFHKIIAGGVALGVTIHAGSHVGCDFPRIAHSNHQRFMDTIAIDFGDRQPSFMAILMTTEVLIGFVMVILMATAYLLANHWFRRNIVKLPWPFHRLTGFNAFWYSHHLFMVVYVLLLVHSFYLFLSHEWTQKTTWMYIAAPLSLYIGERVLRVLRARQYKVNTVKAAIYPGEVLALYMTKPSGFKYQSGMYLFLQCPTVSPFEWHPFSITSAPGDDYLSVHIRIVGDWTREMKRVFREALEHSEKKNTTEESESNKQDARFPKLCIDGPYGAPAQDHKKYDVMLLIGLGIGATPFISILKDVLNHIRLSELNFESPPESSNSISNGSSGSPLSSSSWGSNWLSSPSFSSPSTTLSSPSISSPSPRRRKRSRGPMHAYFYWVTREQGSFEWFKGVMNEVAETDHKAVIEMHNYLTSVYEEGDARSALITLVQALHHAKSGVDIVSGTRVRTHFARPNWQKVFSRLAANHAGAKIGVFYCGPSALAKELDALSRKYTQKSTAKFVFQKESF